MTAPRGSALPASPPGRAGGPRPAACPWGARGPGASPTGGKSEADDTSRHVQTVGDAALRPHVGRHQNTATSVHVQTGCFGQQQSRFWDIDSGPLREPPARCQPRSPPTPATGVPLAPESSLLPPRRPGPLSCLRGSAAAPATPRAATGLTMEPSPFHLSPITGSHTAGTHGPRVSPGGSGGHGLLSARPRPGTDSACGRGRRPRRVGGKAQRPPPAGAHPGPAPTPVGAYRTPAASSAASAPSRCPPPWPGRTRPSCTLRGTSEASITGLGHGRTQWR